MLAGATQPAAARQLKGRIETIFVDGKVTVPVELQASADKFDIRLLEEKKKPRILQAGLKSFPAKLRGEWTGTLKLVSMTINEDKPEGTSDADRRFFKLGRLVNVKFRFYTPGGGIVSMAPPYGKFEKTPDFKGTVYLPMIDPSTGKQLPPPGGGKWSALDTNYGTNSEMLMNKVTMLSNERVEQDLVVHTTLTHKRDRHTKTVLEEHIYDFERVGSFHLKVNLAEVHYDKNGIWLHKLLYRGDVH